MKKNRTVRLDKPVLMSSLRSLEECAILLKTDTPKLRAEFRIGKLPFPAVKVGKEIVCYMPTSDMLALQRAEDVGVTKIYSMYKYFHKHRLRRLFISDNFDWRRYDLRKFK